MHRALFFLLILAGCQTSDKPSPVISRENANVDVQWEYEGDTGPSHWAELSPDFSLCGSGTEQSPVDLADAVSSNEAIDRILGETVLTFDQRASLMDLIDNRHTIQITNDLPMTLVIGDERYELVQYHFHAPSEHTLNGEHAPLEVHFVHESSDENVAVVGVLVDVGESDPDWDQLLDALPDDLDDERRLEGLDLDPEELQPLPDHYYRYTGSLTTPPCSEGVEWIVMSELQHISADQMNPIVSHLHNNNRPVQPLGNRIIAEVDHAE